MGSLLGGWQQRSQVTPFGVGNVGRVASAARARHGQGHDYRLQGTLAWRKKYSAATTPSDATPAATKNANL